MPYGVLTQYEFPNVSNYDGDLRELIKYVKALRDEYKNIDDLVAKIEKEFDETMKAVAELKAEVEDFRTQIDEAVKEGIDEAMIDYDAKITLINQRIEDTNNRVDNLQSLVDDFASIAKNYTDSKVTALSELFFAITSDLQAQIDALQWELPEVYNIVKGVKTDLVTCLYDVYDATRDHAMTALEYDTRGLTASEWDGLQMTALEYDTQSKERLIYGKYRNPFTGTIDDLQTIIDALAQATTDQAITAADYDAAELTADEFNALNLTAHLYDYHAAEYIGA